jgi:hypothetical protein
MIGQYIGVSVPPARATAPTWMISQNLRGTQAITTLICVSQTLSYHEMPNGPNDLTALPSYSSLSMLFVKAIFSLLRRPKLPHYFPLLNSGVSSAALLSLQLNRSHQNMQLNKHPCLFDDFITYSNLLTV